jgi:hypothetical protein
VDQLTSVLAGADAFVAQYQNTALAEYLNNVTINNMETKLEGDCVSIKETELKGRRSHKCINANCARINTHAYSRAESDRKGGVGQVKSFLV